MKINPWMVSTILLVLIVAMMGMFTFTQRTSVISKTSITEGSQKSIELPPVVRPTEITPPIGTVDPNHQTFFNDAISTAKYSVTIPIGQKDGWNITQTVTLDPYYTKGKNIGDKVEINKDRKTITIFRPEASGPAICLFSDSPSFEGPSQKFNKFVELTLGSRPARRGKVESNIPAGKDRYIVCQKDTGSGLYTSWTEFGYISYDAPSGAEVLDMDSITKTLSNLVGI